MKSKGGISEDVILLFDEIYLQKCEEYVGGESIGANEEGGLYKGMVCFMIVGLKSNVPYVIHCAPENYINGEWLYNEIVKCINILQQIGFKVRGISCDNHASNVSAYRKLLYTYASTPSDLSIDINNEKTYLFYDSVHLMKNIRNNLLNSRRFLFPPFSSDSLSESINVPGGEISWRLLHGVHERDQQNQANLRAAPKLTASVLHPGGCKQSVPVALAVFDPTTIAAIRQYIPDKEDAAGFLQLISTWWTISNSKSRFNPRHHLGDAATADDGKTKFLRELAEWVDTWTNRKISNAEKFTLSAQTSSAFSRTLRCHAALIEDLLSEDFDFVMTARFQSDPLERRYGQYRQMSGGRFLVSAKDIKNSEKILKINNLLKEGFDIDQQFKMDFQKYDEVREFLDNVETAMHDPNSIVLHEDSRQISNHIAGYIARKVETACQGCCADQLTTKKSSSNLEYIDALSRGQLMIPSKTLSELVSYGFALLDASSAVIRRSSLPSRKAGESLLNEYLNTSNLCCEKHEAVVSVRIIKIIVNCFFNNQRKRNNESVVNDRIVLFKKNKREK